MEKSIGIQRVKGLHCTNLVCAHMGIIGYLGQIKIIILFRVIGLKILGRVGPLLIFFWEKYTFVHFERHFAFQNALNYIFSRKSKKSRGFTSKSR